MDVCWVARMGDPIEHEFESAVSSNFTVASADQVKFPKYGYMVDVRASFNL